MAISRRSATNMAMRCHRPTRAEALRWAIDDCGPGPITPGVETGASLARYRNALLAFHRESKRVRYSKTKVAASQPAPEGRVGRRHTPVHATRAHGDARRAVPLPRGVARGEGPPTSCKKKRPKADEAQPCAAWRSNGDSLSCSAWFREKVCPVAGRGARGHNAASAAAPTLGGSQLRWLSLSRA